MHLRLPLARALTATLVTVAVTALPAAANAPDPYTGTWKWPLNYVGTYRYDASLGLTWMRNEGNAAHGVIGHSPYRNPDFHVTTSSSANGTMKMANSNVTSCLGSYNWLGCAVYSPSNLTWAVTLATHDSIVRGNNVCWTNDGAYATCSNHPQYDVWTVVLNELGHVSTLGHHVNPDYSDAVVQRSPRYKGEADWKMRSLRWADNDALRLRYGTDACSTPPCPESTES